MIAQTFLGLGLLAAICCSPFSCATTRPNAGPAVCCPEVAIAQLRLQLTTDGMRVSDYEPYRARLEGNYWIVEGTGPRAPRVTIDRNSGDLLDLQYR
jgi:hypothetical protein